MNTSRFIRNHKLSKPWVFFVATFVWSWAFIGISYILGVSAEGGDALGLILILCSISGPALVGISLVYLGMNKEGRRDYFNRAVNFKQIPINWYVIIFTIVPVISLLSIVLRGKVYDFVQVLPSLSLGVISIFLVPTVEELGWRGYALDRLQERYRALSSSLILGVLWWGWHVPLFFLPGSIFTQIGAGSLAFWLYMVNMVALSVIFSWIYNNTGRSTFAAILLHTSIDFCANIGMIPWDKNENAYNVVIFLAIATAIASFSSNIGRKGKVSFILS